MGGIKKSKPSSMEGENKRKEVDGAIIGGNYIRGGSIVVELITPTQAFSISVRGKDKWLNRRRENKIIGAEGEGRLRKTNGPRCFCVWVGWCFWSLKILDHTEQSRVC